MSQNIVKLDDLNKIIRFFSSSFVTIFFSIIGVGGLFYGCGFITLNAHKTMLGVYGVSIPVQEYLYTGGYFFISLFYSPFIFIVNNPIIVFILILAGVFIMILSNRIVSQSKLKDKNQIIIPNKKRFQVDSLRNRFSFLDLKLLFAIFQLLLVIIFLYILTRYSTPALSLSELLLTSSNSDSGEQGLKSDIFIAVINSTDSDSVFLYSIYGGLEVVIIFFTWNLLHLNSKQIRTAYSSFFYRTFLKSVIFIMGMMLIVQMVLLPINYGRLIQSTKYPIVNLTLKSTPNQKISLFEKNTSKDFEKVWLIYNTPSEIAVYIVHSHPEEGLIKKPVIINNG